MKSLEERKQQRAEQRILLSHGGVIPRIDKEGQSGLEQGGDSTSNKDQFEEMTKAELKDWVKSKGGEVPADKQNRDSILEYTRNYAAYLEANPQPTTSQNSSWSQQ